MTREEKIAAIYAEMANKELTRGCKVKIKYDNISYGEALEEIRNPVEEILTVSLGGVARKDNIEIEKYQILSADSNGYIEDLETLVQIIGHPVMIGDVLHWIGEKKFNTNTKILGFGFEDSERLDDESKLWLIQNHYSGRVCASWLDKRTPIEDQSDGCIDYVYSLIQKD